MKRCLLHKHQILDGSSWPAAQRKLILFQPQDHLLFLCGGDQGRRDGLSRDRETLGFTERRIEKTAKTSAFCWVRAPRREREAVMPAIGQGRIPTGTSSLAANKDSKDLVEITGF